MKKQIFILSLLLSTVTAMAQNNAIFNGGSNDGWERTGYSQAAGNIFIGGNNDGWANAAYQQATSNIFNGGNGDGWSQIGFLQPVVNIYNGGISDGWSATGFLQAGNGIFNGGEGDGWNSTLLFNPDPAIYQGGEGDGWANTYRPMGPLPVRFLSFTAQKRDATALLQWITAQEINSAYFEVQRSADAVNFEKIGRVAASGNSQVNMTYDFTDVQPVSGYNYYRLKQVDIDGAFTFTPTRMVRFSDHAAEGVNCYPNPVLEMLNISIPGNYTQSVTIVTISNNSGIVLNQHRFVTPVNGNLQINMGIYPPGVYFIQVRNRTKNSAHRIIVQ